MNIMNILVMGGDIYDELLHIPLIIKDGRFLKGGKKIPKVVSSVDIVPTILRRINPIWCIFNKYKFNGRDLKRVIDGKDIKRKYIYSYSPGQWSIRDINKNVKYILYQNGKEELYFLPDEYNNLIKDDSLKNSSIREDLKENLELWLEHYPIRSDINAKKVPLDEQVKDNLRSLGYLQ